MKLKILKIVEPTFLFALFAGQAILMAAIFSSTAVGGSHGEAQRSVVAKHSPAHPHGICVIREDARYIVKLDRDGRMNYFLSRPLRRLEI